MSFRKILTTLAFLYIVTHTFGIDCRKFPRHFKFGTATAAYQIEGAWNEDGKGQNIWDNYTHTYPERIQDGSNGDISTDAYHHFKTDILLIKQLGVDFYRFSISWSRILPTGYLSGGINEKGVQHYNNILNLLKINGIEAMVTLYHWDLPEQLQQDFGGWLNESLVDVFSDYSRLAFKLFGDRVKYWGTINEPSTFCEQSYENGLGAPSITDKPGEDIYKCGHTVLLAHAAVYHIYDKEFRHRQHGQVSLVLNSNWIEPGSNSTEDQEAAERVLQFNLGWFAHPLIFGNYPQVMIDRIGEKSRQENLTKSRLPEFTEQQIQSIKGTHDFFAINHYTTQLAKWIQDNKTEQTSYDNDISVSLYTDPNWEGSASPWLFVVPSGFRKLLNWIKNSYNNPTIIVTENGYSDPGGILNDDRRINYFEEYLSSLLEAMHDDKVKVVGYTVWTLLDDFEWSAGYGSKFGVYSVNFTDPNRGRTPKASVSYIRYVIKRRRVAVDCDNELI